MNDQSLYNDGMLCVQEVSERASISGEYVSLCTISCVCPVDLIWIIDNTLTEHSVVFSEMAQQLSVHEVEYVCIL